MTSIEKKRFPISFMESNEMGVTLQKGSIETKMTIIVERW